jgi:alginate O-acetyltransferase complex protein AlgI
MFKKVLIANQLGVLADTTFSGNAGLSTASAWLGIAAYSLQIFFDFSGYSDMAIGLGKMFGFTLPENFNYPYISKSVAEYWRRWHISLGSWFRDYEYIPLGGSRVSNLKKYRNLFIVWFLTGMWHGPSWTFICWGLYFGVLIALERLILNKVFSKIWTGFSHIYLVLCVMLGWVFFRANSFGFSVHYIKVMFGFEGNGLFDAKTLEYINDYGLIIVLGIIFSMPVINFVRAKIESRNARILQNDAVYLLNSVVYAGLFIMCILMLISSTYNPFLYFRF